MSLIRYSFLILGIQILTLSALFGQSAELFPPKPEPAVYVHDYSGWLTGVQKYELEQQLRAMNDTTSTQIVLMIRPDIGDYDRPGYAIQLGNKWGIGQNQKDNGILILVVTEGSQRGVFITTGYGLEGALPDVVASRIARNQMIPYFQQGRYYEGIVSGVLAVSNAVHGEYDSDAGNNDSSSLFGLLLIFLIIILFFIVLTKRSGGRMITSTGGYDDAHIPKGPYSTRRPRHTSTWGGGWYGGGGWGGSGSSGGGWGGGSFGGGSFGGGGGGGSW